MKNIVFALVVVLFPRLIMSQANVNADCINAITLCNNPSFPFYQTSGSGSVIDFSVTSSVSNPTTDPFPPSAGCLKQGELKPQWLILTVGNCGILEFVFGAANSPNPQAGCYDWIMWPYTPTTCAGINNNTLPPIRCCWNTKCSGGTGLATKAHAISLGGDTLDFLEPLKVNACDQFIICISNFSGVDTDVSFESFGTASLSCNPNCNPNYTICHGDAATVTPVNFACLANPSYTLMPGNLSNTTGSFVVSPGSTTTYTAYIKGTNQSNAVETVFATSIVSVMPKPTAAVSVTQSNCVDLTTKLNVQITWAPQAPSSYTIEWLPNPPNGVLTPTSTTATAVMVPGVYTVVVRAPGGCTSSQSFTVDPPLIQPTITLNPPQNTHTLTCYDPTLAITAINSSQNYTWTNLFTTTLTGPTAVVSATSVGNWTVTAQHTLSGCSTSATFAVIQNTAVPLSVLGPTFQNITCTVSSIQTVTASATPTSFVSHHVMAPLGGTFSIASHTMVYLPGGVGEYTHCTVNEINGCSSCKTFTVYSNQGFPTFTLVSPQNFSLGCNTRSVAAININSASATNSAQVPTGGGVTYTLLAPWDSIPLTTGPLSTLSNYTVNAPGTWTVVTRDNSTACETRVPVTVLLNTKLPNLAVAYKTTILDCNTPSVVLEGSSTTPNVSYTWRFPGTPPTKQNFSLVVNSNTALPTQSLVANYTLEVMDMSSTCESASVIPIYQSLFPPKAAFSGTGALSCNVKSIMLTNQSESTVPDNSIFQSNQPAIGFLWQGPTPQVPQSNSTSYVAKVPGVYTVTAKDLNNGCTSTYTGTIDDNIKFPGVNTPDKPAPSIIDCGAKQATLMPILTTFTAGATYTWTHSGEAVTSDNNKIPFYVDRAGEYRLAVRNPSSGCVTNVIMSVVNGQLMADFKPDKEFGYPPLTVNFENASRSSTGTSSITSVWSFGNGKTHTVSGVSSASSVFNSPGTFSVTLFVTKGNCLKSVTKEIKVEIPSELEVPNIFTPNDDGINDEFFVKATNLTSIEFLVTDRWGHEVYKITSGTGNVLWDGKNQSGRKVAEGVYFYILKSTGADGVEHNMNGTVTVAR